MSCFVIPNSDGTIRAIVQCDEAQAAEQDQPGVTMVSITAAQAAEVRGRPSAWRVVDGALVPASG